MPCVYSVPGVVPAAIAIEQRSSGSSPRSIIATTTEIYDYLRLLYSHVGQPYCPETGVPVVRQTTTNIADKILAATAARERRPPPYKPGRRAGACQPRCHSSCHKFSKRTSATCPS
jgi:excinuclease UvrABC ATPase subunit